MTKLTTEELDAICHRAAPTFADDFTRLKLHIDAITAELSQAQAELAALRAGVREVSALPARGNIQFKALRRAVKLAIFDSDQVSDDAICYQATENPGHQMLPAINYNSLNRIVSAFAAAPQPPAREDHGHAARLNRLLGILRQLKWVQNEEATMLSPTGPADALNELGLFMFSDAIDRAVEHKQPPAQAPDFGYNQTTKRVLAGIKARPEAVVKAETLREEADKIDVETFGHNAVTLVLAEADRIYPPTT